MQCRKCLHWSDGVEHVGAISGHSQGDWALDGLAQVCELGVGGTLPQCLGAGSGCLGSRPGTGLGPDADSALFRRALTVYFFSPPFVVVSPPPATASGHGARVSMSQLHLVYLIWSL